jgi:hypothetical protein
MLMLMVDVLSDSSPFRGAREVQKGNIIPSGNKSTKKK